MPARVIAEIRLDALRHNLQQVRRLVPSHTKIMAALKANAYGHGALHAAKVLQYEADAFALACLDEAMEIRQAGIRTPLVLLEGVLDKREFQMAASHEMMIVLHDTAQLQLLAEYRGPIPPKVWLKMDTGMGRLGFLPESIVDAFAQIQKSDAQFCGWMSHFASADLLESPKTKGQIHLFQKNIQNIHSQYHFNPSGLPICSLANSAGILAHPETHLDWVRPGIMLYGSSPFAAHSADHFDLKPVMTLKSRLLSIKNLPAGHSVGYAAKYATAVPQTVGFVAIGYADGYPRHLPTGTPILVNGQRTQLLGRVSMDMIAVDLAHIPDAQVGDEVILWGDGLPIDDIAARAGTISYELMCGLTRRVQYVYV